MAYGKNNLQKIVLGLIIKKDNSILLVKRKKAVNKRKWVFPGGFVEISENNINALEREIYEEANIITKIMKKIGERVYSNKSLYYYKGIYIYGKTKPDKIETIDAKFFSPKEIRKILDKRKVYNPIWKIIKKLDKNYE